MRVPSEAELAYYAEFHALAHGVHALEFPSGCGLSSARLGKGSEVANIRANVDVYCEIDGGGFLSVDFVTKDSVLQWIGWDGAYRSDSQVLVVDSITPQGIHVGLLEFFRDDETQNGESMRSVWEASAVSMEIPSICHMASWQFVKIPEPGEMRASVSAVSTEEKGAVLSFEFVSKDLMLREIQENGSFLPALASNERECASVIVDSMSPRNIHIGLLRVLELMKRIPEGSSRSLWKQQPAERIELAMQRWDSISEQRNVRSEARLHLVKRRRAELEADGELGDDWETVLDDIEKSGG